MAGVAPGYKPDGERSLKVFGNFFRAGPVAVGLRRGSGDTVLPAGASQGASSPCISRACLPFDGQDARVPYRLEAGGYALAGCQCHMGRRSHPFRSAGVMVCRG